LEELEVQPVDESLRRYKSKWLRHVTRKNSNKMTKIMTKCRLNRRRRLERPWKRALDETALEETALDETETGFF
jgi:hypothetical protein